MAGRIKEIINNKFYFVLDEVGASDGESELSTEGRSIGKENLSMKIDLENSCSNECAANVSRDSSDSNEVNDRKHRISESGNDRSEDSQKLENEGISGKPVASASIIVEQSHSSSKLKNIVDRTAEENSVIDMDIDSEGECRDSGDVDAEPLVRISFRDSTASKLLKPVLMRFFSQKVDDYEVVTSDDNKLELKVYNRDSIKLLKDDLVSFDMDTTPTHGNHCDVPHYGKNHDLVLSNKIAEDEEGAKLRGPTKTTCFNCLENHNLKDCDKEKDFRVISRNRQIFQNEMKMSKVSRYHLDEAQRFSAIQPGSISKKLRNALSLRSDQQPSFIYRMRVLGYPPAWLEEAKVSHSGVAMYDTTGVPVLEDDEEEGEILPEGSKDKFDITKIIEFPGFNVPLPDNCKDEAKLYGCPDISEEQSKENLIQILKPKTIQAYVKKSMSSTKVDNPQEESKRPPSPTIEEMEEKKRQLLMELDDVESSPLSKLNFDDLSSGAGTETEGTQGSETKEPGTVRNSEFGTPILKSISPFSKLPSREQFSVNVSDVINFENLPNSTGKYETMRHVITKIRISASKAQGK
ncbi:hypothetical protein RUM44_008782 [Polyplax serrata]|uniref:PSP proline-rich domain-containing protein n=1 Tax=Polyplax serrata TaxID=468196 RepID=A0ABR1BE49_POLSC